MTIVRHNLWLEFRAAWQFLSSMMENICTRWNWGVLSREAMHKSRFSVFHLLFILKSDVTSKYDMDMCIEDVLERIYFESLRHTFTETFRLPSSCFLSLCLSLSLSFFVRPIQRGFTLSCGICECNVMSFFSESAYASTHVCPVSPIVIQPAAPVSIEINETRWDSCKLNRNYSKSLGLCRPSQKSNHQ